MIQLLRIRDATGEQFPVGPLDLAALAFEMQILGEISSPLVKYSASPSAQRLLLPVSVLTDASFFLLEKVLKTVHPIGAAGQEELDTTALKPSFVGPGSEVTWL